MATLDDLVHCPICLEVYDQPRALPCLHTFCNTCIQEFITAALRTKPSSTGFECPVCRRHTDPPGSAHHSAWSKLFPLNHIIVSLIDSRDDLSTNRQKKESGDSVRSVGPSNAKPSVTSSSQDCTTTTNPARMDIEHTKTFQEHFESDFEKGHEHITESYPDEVNWSPPPHHPPPHHGPPPHWGPPPHHHFPPPHGPPPHHGLPGHPPHGPPPPHHGPHHGGRGCHRPPHGGFGGRFHHPHGPRHRHHHPGPKWGCPP